MSFLRRFRLYDLHDHDALVSSAGALGVHQPIRLVGAAFVGSTVDSNFWSTHASGTGAAVTQATLAATIASGTANSGTATLYSAKKSRYVSPFPNQFHAVLRIPTVVVALNTRRWGAYTHTTGTPQNGFAFELSAAGVLSVVTYTGATPTAVSSGSFNGDVTSYTLDTDLHAFEIEWGLSGVEFRIDGALIHTVAILGEAALPIADILLNASFTSTNSASGTTSGTIIVSGGAILRLGPERAQTANARQSGTGTVVLKYGPGMLRAINIAAVVNNAVVTLYDNTAASGTTLWASGTMGANTVPFAIPLDGIAFETGLTLDITGASAAAVVTYE